MRRCAPGGQLQYLEGGHESGFTKAGVVARDRNGRPLADRDASQDEMLIKGCAATLIRTKATGIAAAGKEFVEVTHGKMDPEHLLTKAVYLIDAGIHLFVWIGSTANANEKDSALAYAERYLRERDGGDSLPSTTIHQGYETPLFLDLFDGFNRYDAGCETTIAFVLRDHIEQYPPGMKRKKLEKKIIQACEAACQRGNVGGQVTIALRSVLGAFQQDAMNAASKHGTIQCLIDCSKEAAAAIINNVGTSAVEYRYGIQVSGNPCEVSLTQAATHFAEQVALVGSAAPTSNSSMQAALDDDIMRIADGFLDEEEEEAMVLITH